jgi:hypothetical protein
LRLDLQTAKSNGPSAAVHQNDDWTIHYFIQPAAAGGFVARVSMANHRATQPHATPRSAKPLCLSNMSSVVFSILESAETATFASVASDVLAAIGPEEAGPGAASVRSARALVAGKEVILAEKGELLLNYRLLIGRNQRRAGPLAAVQLPSVFLALDDVGFKKGVMKFKFMLAQQF